MVLVSNIRIFEKLYWVEKIGMMTALDSIEAYKRINGWKIIADFAVGGFEWLGFSKKQPNLMLCISSQNNTVLNCDNGAIEECEIVYDENELVAYCDLIPAEEIAIAGQYGGKLPLTSVQGDKVFVQVPQENIQKIIFVSKKERTEIYWNYNPYIYGFSPDGNYFVLADDGGITLLKRV